MYVGVKTKSFALETWMKKMFLEFLLIVVSFLLLFQNLAVQTKVATSTSPTPVAVPAAPSPVPEATSPDPVTPSPDPAAQSPDPTTPSPDPATQSPDPANLSPDLATQSPVPAAPSPVPSVTTPATSTPAPSNPLNTSGQGNNKESIASELAAALLRQYDTGMEGDILSQSMSDQLQVSVCSHLFLCHKLAWPSECFLTTSYRFGWPCQSLQFREAFHYDCSHVWKVFSFKKCKECFSAFRVFILSFIHEIWKLHFLAVS